MTPPPLPQPLRAVPSRAARVLGPVALVLALGAAAATPLALDARSGHGDGMGDLGPLLLLAIGAFPVVVGTLVATAGVFGGSPGTVGAGAGVTVLGLLLVAPAGGFDDPRTTLVAALDVGAAVATTAAAVLARRPPGVPGS